MKERLIEFLKAENKSSAQFAEEIGVQPSGISHILSGRNNPSLDFILKMLEKYKFLSTDWLLFGKGTMYKDIKMQSLFEKPIDHDSDSNVKQIKNESVKSDIEFQDIIKDEQRRDFALTDKNKDPVIEKIVWFYDNKSFEEYFPQH